MKLTFAFLAFLLFASCSNNSSPGSNNNSNTSGGDTVSVHGVDYFPLPPSYNTSVNGHILGSVTYMDANGQITGIDQVDHDAEGQFWGNGNNYAGAYGSFIGGPLYWANFSLAARGNAIFGHDGYRDFDSAIVLPASFRPGDSWQPSVRALPIQCHMNFVQHLSTFTGKDGTKYTDVIELSGTYLDSNSNYKYSASATLYFANGIGPVEVDNIQFDQSGYDLFDDGNYGQYHHEIGSGSAWRKY